MEREGEGRRVLSWRFAVIVSSDDSRGPRRPLNHLQLQPGGAGGQVIGLVYTETAEEGYCTHER